GGAAHRAGVGGRVAGVRAWVRLPDRARSGAARPQAGDPAHGRPGRVGGGRGPVLGGLPDRVARRVAAAGPYGSAGVGCVSRAADAVPARHPGAFRGGMIEVLTPGPYATVQDMGRHGYAHLGVPCSGAADAASLRLANRLVGNPERLAGIEITFGMARLRFPAGAWVALAGAPCPVSGGASGA